MEPGYVAVIADVALLQANRLCSHNDVNWRYGGELEQHRNQPRIQVEILVDGFGAWRWSIAIVAGNVGADVSWEWELHFGMCRKQGMWAFGRPAASSPSREQPNTYAA